MNFPGDHYLHNCPIDPEAVEKLWGTEYVISRAPHVAKILVVQPKRQSSWHAHLKKQETFILIEGELIVEMMSPGQGKTTAHLKSPYSSLTLLPCVLHTFYVPKNQTTPTVFIEAATEDNPDDSYRFTRSGPRE